MVGRSNERFAFDLQAAVRRASELGLKLAGVHPVDVFLSKVLHHYLLRGQSLLGNGAYDAAKSCFEHFLVILRCIASMCDKYDYRVDRNRSWASI